MLSMMLSIALQYFYSKNSPEYADFCVSLRTFFVYHAQLVF